MCELTKGPIGESLPRKNSIINTMFENSTFLIYSYMSENKITGNITIGALK